MSRTRINVLPRSIVPSPMDWQDPDLYIIGVEPTEEGSWTPIWCNGEHAWVTGEHIQVDEWREYEKVVDL